MSLFNRSPTPVECRHDDFVALINRLLDENRELRERLLPTPAPAVGQAPESGTEKADVVAGWRPPRQRVKDYIESINPASSLPLLSEDDVKFLENSRQ